MVPMVQTEINGRWSLFLPEHRAARPEWETGWERERLDSMHEHLTALEGHMFDYPSEYPDRHRPVIIDVGVEEGDLTALFSKWGCDVVMVEPNPRVWPNVRAIWKANGLRPPLALWVGFAGDQSSSADDGLEWQREHVWRPADWSDLTGPWPMCAYGEVIGDHAFLHLAQHPHVPCLTLDQLAANVPRVDAITMDVEGSELRVLRGAEGILRRDRPLVWVSVHTDQQWMDENYPLAGRDAVVRWMDARGYEGQLLAIDHEEHWFFRHPEGVGA